MLTAQCCAIALAMTACASKTPPRSTTTTRTQTNTQEGDVQTTTDVKETTVNQQDGSQSVKRTTSTDQTTPAPAR